MPNRRDLPAINIRPKEMPFDQIIAVKGRNPFGEALPGYGKVLSDAMIQQANLRKMGQQTAAIERAMGSEPGSLNGMDPSQGMEFAKMQNDLRREAMKQQKEQNQQTRSVFVSEFKKNPEPYLQFEQSGGKLNFINDLSEGNREKNLDRRDVQLGNNLRGQFLSQSRPFSEISQAYNRVQAAASVPTAAGDLSMLYNYMKILDPTSVVRESEFAQAAASGSYGERMKASVNRLANGQRLSDEIRNDFLFQASQLYKGQEKLHSQREDEFRRIATEQNLDPNSIIVNMRDIGGQVANQGQSPQPNTGIALTGSAAQRLAELRAKRSAGALR